MSAYRRADTSPFQCVRGKLNIPLPETDGELEILSEIYFGMPLHLKTLRLYGRGASYEVAEKYSSYHGKGFKYTGYCTTGYDHSEIFWKTVIGPLYCGGIAGRSYGQVNVKGHRHQTRLERWINNRRNGISYVRTPFVRLARKHGAGESSAIRGSAAPTCGREDGAQGVFNSTGDKT